MTKDEIEKALRPWMDDNHGFGAALMDEGEKSEAETELFKAVRTLVRQAYDEAADLVETGRGVSVDYPRAVGAHLANRIRTLAAALEEK